MTTKVLRLKGCRPSKEVIQEYSNLFAEYGAARHRLDHSLPKEIKAMETRIAELKAELDEAKRQEALQAPEANEQAAMQ